MIVNFLLLLHFLFVPKVSSISHFLVIGLWSRSEKVVECTCTFLLMIVKVLRYSSSSFRRFLWPHRWEGFLFEISDVKMQEWRVSCSQSHSCEVHWASFFSTFYLLFFWVSSLPTNFLEAALSDFEDDFEESSVFLSPVKGFLNLFLLIFFLSSHYFTFPEFNSEEIPFVVSWSLSDSEDSWEWWSWFLSSSEDSIRTRSSLFSSSKQAILPYFWRFQVRYFCISFLTLSIPLFEGQGHLLIRTALHLVSNAPAQRQLSTM